MLIFSSPRLWTWCKHNKRKQKNYAIFRGISRLNSISTPPTRRIWPPLWDVSSLVTVIRGHNITNPINALLFSGNPSKSVYICVWSLPNGSQWPLLIVTFAYAFNFPHGISIGKTLVIFLMRLGKIGDDVGLNCSPFNGNGIYIKNNGKQTKTSKTLHVHVFCCSATSPKSRMLLFVFFTLDFVLGQIFETKREVQTLENGMKNRGGF